MNGIEAHQRRRGLTLRSPERPLPRRKRFWRQVSNHSVALISLFLAATSLGYNTWRNETTEVQRNLRQASFQVLVELGELNQIVLYRRYFQAPTEPGAVERRPDLVFDDARSWVGGWGKVTMVRDLTSFMPEPLPSHGSALFSTWETDAAHLNSGSAERRDQASTALLAEIEGLRSATVQMIDSLR